MFKNTQKKNKELKLKCSQKHRKQNKFLFFYKEIFLSSNHIHYIVPTIPHWKTLDESLFQKNILEYYPAVPFLKLYIHIYITDIVVCYIFNSDVPDPEFRIRPDPDFFF